MILEATPKRCHPLVDTFKLSTDPQFIAKVRDVVGLYRDAPEAAMVLCVDEKTPVQALGPHRADPAAAAGGAPAAEPRLHSSWHHQPVCLGCGLRQGHLPNSRPPPCHRIQAAPGRVDKQIPAGLDLHTICDNSSTHKTPAIQRWLLAHPRMHLHYTPTYSSWLNLVERWFAELLITTKWLRRGTHRSVTQLQHSIQTWIDTWNQNPRPFVWTKTRRRDPRHHAAYCQRINDSGE